MTVPLWALVSYFLGSIPTSLLVGKAAKGIDLRLVGSKNLGATNLYRTLGWRYAIPVALFDAAKGAIPVLWFGPLAGGGRWTPLVLGAAAVVGHVFSIFARFRGGKGVATAAGVVLGLAPWAVLLCLVLWAIVVWLTGYVSLGSIIGAAALPIVAYFVHPAGRDSIWVLAVLALFVIVMHRANIQRLLAGTENRFRTRPLPQGAGLDGGGEAR
jgi:acyl phosphate:glycerol-3-phosphate acyltransferase